MVREPASGAALKRGMSEWEHPTFPGRVGKDNLFPVPRPITKGAGDIKNGPEAGGGVI